MQDDSDLESLIAAMARGEPLDLEAAFRRVTRPSDRARLEALAGIQRIAAFSHEQWRDLATGEAATAGQMVGAYELETLIGSGGMGAVWRARRVDGRFEGHVAVKVLHMPRVDGDGRMRFEREGQILARMRHPNIAQLMDAGIASSGQPYLVLEHVDGMAIDRYCEVRGLDGRGRVELFLDVLRAVAYAHANLVLHRDLKPSNILVDGAGCVKLLDFGIAKLLERDGEAVLETELTQRAGHAFTPEFAAPEQLRGGPVTTAMDVYAAGVVLYLLLTGRHPTPGGRGSPLERMQAILDTQPRLASATITPAEGPDATEGKPAPCTRRELQGDLDNILAKALKKLPEERYPNAEALAADLRRYLNQEPVTARPDRIPYRLGKFVRRNRIAVGSATIAVLALVTSTAVAVSQLVEARRQRDEAQRQQEEARQQAQRAEAFNTVVTSLLSQSGPGGRPFTQEELLDHAVGEMEALYAGDPPFLIDMLIRISGRYLDLANANKEYATLVRAEEVAKRAGDPVLIFDTMINTVETDLERGDYKAAKQRLENAQALLPTIGKPPHMVEYLRAQAIVAEAEGNVPAALEYVDGARRDLEAEGKIHGNTYVGILSLLRLYHTDSGNVREAHDVAVKWAALEKSNRRENSRSGLHSRIVLAASVHARGEALHARDLFEAAGPDFKEIGAGKVPESPSATWYRYGDVLSRLGRHDIAIAAIRSAVDVVRRDGNQFYAIPAQVVLCRAYLRAGRLDDMHAELDDAIRVMMANEPGNLSTLIEAHWLRGEGHLAAGRLEAAEDEVHEALRRLGYPEKQRGPGLPNVLLSLARVQRAQGHATGAAESARAAVRMFEWDAIDPAQSADVGEALLELAQDQIACGDHAEAAKSLAAAVRALRNGLGSDHPVTKQAERLSPI